MFLNDILVINPDSITTQEILSTHDKFMREKINKQCRVINEFQKILASQIHLTDNFSDCYNSSIIVIALTHYEDYLKLRINETKPKN